MATITLAILSISVLFAVGVLFGNVLKNRVCVICASVSLTWLELLILFWFGWSINPLMIGILMGGSVVGLLYLVFANVPKQYHVFKLPFVITLFTIVYFLLSGIWYVKNTYVIVILAWLISAVVFVFRDKNNHMSALAKKLIACCKDW